MALLELRGILHSNANERHESDRDGRICSADIGGLKDIVLYGPNWPNLEPFYEKREKVQRNFDDFVRIRIAHRAHPRHVDPVVWDKGRGAITWIRKCLEMYEDDEETSPVTHIR